MPTLKLCDVIGQPQRRESNLVHGDRCQIINQSDSSSADGHHSNIVALCTLEGNM